MHNVGLVRVIEKKEDEMDGTCSTHGRNQNCVENSEGKRLLGRPLHGKAVLKQILKKQGMAVSSEFSWLRIESNGGILSIRKRNARFRKGQSIS
jgi:hypothetical protein